MTGESKQGHEPENEVNCTEGMSLKLRGTATTKLHSELASSESSKPQKEVLTHAEADEKLIKEYIQKLDDALFHWNIIKYGSILTKEQYLIRYGETKVRAESEKEIAELKAEIKALKKSVRDRSGEVIELTQEIEKLKKGKKLNIKDARLVV